MPQRKQVGPETLYQTSQIWIESKEPGYLQPRPQNQQDNSSCHSHMHQGQLLLYQPLQMPFIFCNIKQILYTHTHTVGLVQTRLEVPPSFPHHPEHPPASQLFGGGMKR